ncbi:hypothetical protein ANTPLA_LOCUS3536 [Anthophora plagiata]
MCDKKKLVIPITAKSQMDNNISTNDVIVRKENKRKMGDRQKARKKFVFLHTISLILLHVLDAMLLIILLPYMIWQWVSGRDRLKIILKSIVEVTGELIIWTIFAGVSVLMTVIFVLEDIYFRKNDDKKSKELQNARNEITLCGKETQSFSNEQYNLKVPES